MQRLAIVLVALAITVTLPGAQAAPPEVDAFRIYIDDVEADELELLNADGNLTDAVIRLEVETSDDISTAEVTLDPACSQTVCEPFTLALSDPDSDGNWSVDIDAGTESRLVATTWTAEVRLVGPGGVQIEEQDADLTVLATNDTAAPVLSVVGAAGGVIDIGIGQGVQLFLDEPLLALVSYDAAHVINGPKAVDHPYRLDGTLFEEGRHEVVFKAHDRALRTTTVLATVHKDTTKPLVELATVETQVYRDVQHSVAVAVSDASAFNITLQADGRSYFADGVGGGENGEIHRFALTFNDTGDRTVRAVVVDALGNSKAAELTYSVVHPIADMELAEVRIEPEYPLGSDEVTITVTSAQPTGVKVQEATVKIDLGSIEAQTQGVVVSPGEEQDVSFQVVPLIGRNTVVATLEADDADLNETDGDNQRIEVNFTVYFGKVVYGADEFYIQIGANGLPESALNEDGTEYSLGLEEIRDREVWAFDFEGKQLFWDSLERVTEHDRPVEEPKDTPVAGLLPVLALLGLAAFIRRR